MWDDGEGTRGRVERVRPPLPDGWTWDCRCGRTFTTAQGRGTHRARCAVEAAIAAWEVARILDICAAARARVAARTETRDTSP